MKNGLLKDQSQICFNLEKWNVNEIPILLITGLAGSGKTTFAKKYAFEHKAVCISFDVLKFYAQSSKKSKEILDLFLEQHPDIQQYVDIHWEKVDRENSNNILFNYYCNIFFDFLVEYSIQNKIKIVLEGIQMYVRLHPSKSIGLPLIIIRTSCWNSFLNKIKRDHINTEKKQKWYCDVKIIFKDLYIYYIIQQKNLNSYIRYITTVYHYT